jgi:heme oxygenase
LHHHPGFAAVQAGTIDHPAYAALLSRVYGFYGPFEAAAQVEPKRTRWLEADLAALRVDAVQREALACCTAFPPRLSPDYVLGARYVVEGSSLGGRGMARQLDALLGSEATDGRRFFSGYGSETGAVWRAYLLRLAAVPGTEQNRAGIVAGATATFAIFERWLDGWDNNHG